jgi:DoxX-like protein
MSSGVRWYPPCTENGRGDDHGHCSDHARRVGGILLLAGLCTRPVAAVLAIEMLTAFVMVHAPRGAVPMQNGGEVPLLYALAFVFLAGNGAGRLSVDNILRDDTVAEPRDRLRSAA